MAIYRGAGGASEATDAATISQVQTYAAQAATSAAAAATSATSAASNATGASSSASAAATSASNALSYRNSAASYVSDASGYADDAAQEADDAANSALASLNYSNAASGHATDANGYMNNAQTYMERAEAAAANAATSYDNFDDRYLGAKSSNPTVDNDGNALLTGALYFNTSAPEMRVYSGSAWVNFEPSGGSVTSFNDRTGAITLSDTDVTDALGYAPLQSTDIANMLESTDIGVTVQGYNANTVVDASYVHTDNNYTTTEKSKLAGIEAGAQVNPTNISAFTNDSGYLTSYTETDPIYTASTWYTTTNNSSNWDTAYGWGNHASAGYLTSSSTVDGGTY